MFCVIFDIAREDKDIIDVERERLESYTGKVPGAFCNSNGIRSQRVALL